MYVLSSLSPVRLKLAWLFATNLGLGAFRVTVLAIYASCKQSLKPDKGQDNIPHLLAVGIGIRNNLLVGTVQRGVIKLEIPVLNPKPRSTCPEDGQNRNMRAGHSSY